MNDALRKFLLIATTAVAAAAGRSLVADARVGGHQRLASRDVGTAHRPSGDAHRGGVAGPGVTGAVPRAADLLLQFSRGRRGAQHRATGPPVRSRLLPRS